MNKIFVSNFRGIKDLCIQNTKQFNLIAGKNNCGKSSILEAIYSVIGIPKLSLHILNDIRILKTTNNNDLTSLFFNADKSLPIILELETAKIKRNIEIKSINEQNNLSLIYKNQKNGFDISVKNIDNDYSVFIDYDKINTNQELISQEDSLKIQNDNFHIPVFLWGAQWENFNFSNYLEKLIVSKKIDSVLELLQEIEPSVKNIQLGNEGKIYIDLGLANLLPVQVMGEGFIKTLALVSIISTLKDGIILIDEFENGLHFSSMDILWKGVIESCKKNNVILFATTHSYECIQSFFDNTESNQSILFRIEKKSDKHSIFSFNKEQANIAFDENWEIR